MIGGSVNLKTDAPHINIDKVCKFVMYPELRTFTYIQHKLKCLSTLYYNRQLSLMGNVANAGA